MTYPDLNKRDKRPSEFGGVPGLIQPQVPPSYRNAEGELVQPDGHTPDGVEKQMLLRGPDPSPRWKKGDMVVDDLPEGFDPGERVV